MSNPPPNFQGKWKKLVVAFQHKSDRASAILGATYLETSLKQLIVCFLIDDPKATHQLLNEEGPLGSFHARLKAAYCMGLLSKTEYHDLNLIIEIRNMFANAIEINSFTNNEIRDKCYRLRIPHEVLVSTETQSPKHLFVFTSTILAQHLALRCKQAAKAQRSVPSEFILVETDI